MDKEVVVYIQNGILLSHKKEHIWISSMGWMNLESIIQSEVSQKRIILYFSLKRIIREKDNILNIFVF